MIMQILCKFSTNETAPESGKGSGNYWARAEHGKACPCKKMIAKNQRNTRVKLKSAHSLEKVESLCFFFSLGSWKLAANDIISIPVRSFALLMKFSFEVASDEVSRTS